MIKLGNYNELEAARFAPQGVYLKSGNQEALLPGKYIPQGLKEGDRIRVFIYADSEDRLIATTRHPKGVEGDFVALDVVDVNRYGAFMDWGLEKDLMVPFSEQEIKMEKGRKYLVRICVDNKTNRLVGSARIRFFLKKDKPQIEEGDRVRLIVFGSTDLGFKVIVNGQYEGLLYRNEVFEPLVVGDIKEGFVKKIREDNKIDVSLHQAGMEGVRDAETIVMQKLNAAGGFLPYHDKTDPGVISREFHLSKKNFKKAIGGLYKQRKILLTQDGIRKTGHSSDQ